MNFRTAGAVAALMLGLAASGDHQAFAQYYPSQAYPPQQAYPPPYRPLPPLAAADDDVPLYDPPVVRAGRCRRPLSGGMRSSHCRRPAFH